MKGKWKKKARSSMNRRLLEDEAAKEHRQVQPRCTNTNNKTKEKCDELR